MKKLLPLISPSFAKSCFTLIYFLIFSLNLISQNSSKTITAPENEWKLYKELAGVKVYTQIDECHDFKNGTHYEYIMLKFVNTTLSNKKIKWVENLYYNGICNTCDGNSDKQVYEFELASKQIKQGNCELDENDMFRIFNRFLNYTDKPVLTKFELINFEIE
jgi:hypothetical protein